MSYKNSYKYNILHILQRGWRIDGKFRQNCIKISYLIQRLVTELFYRGGGIMFKWDGYDEVVKRVVDRRNIDDCMKTILLDRPKLHYNVYGYSF